MSKGVLVRAAFAAALVAAAPGAMAQPASPPTPTTRILAIGTIQPGADLQQVRRILPGEMQATAELYLQGKIDQWYSLQGRPGVVFILNVTDPAMAKEMLEALPLGREHLMSFELVPLGPLTPLRQLLPAQPQ
jgi:Muconolactone delta-isomerase